MLASERTESLEHKIEELRNENGLLMKEIDRLKAAPECQYSMNEAALQLAKELLSQRRVKLDACNHVSCILFLSSAISLRRCT